MFHPAIFFAALSGFLSSLTAAILAEGQPEPVAGWNTYMFWACVAGSLGGGMLYVILDALTIQTTETSLARAGKFVGSSIISGLFSPVLILYWSVPQSPIYVLAFSGAVGLVGWSVLFTLFPFVIKRLVNIGKAALGEQSDSSPPAQK